MHFIQTLEDAGELLRVKEFVSPDLEITEIADRFVKNSGKALLFENTGTDFPLLINAFGSDRRMALALGVNDLDDIGKEIAKIFHDLTGPKNSLLDKLKVLPNLQTIASWLPKTITGKGACQEVVMKVPDLTKLPVLTCWPADGGRFITFPMVHTRDPETGLRNLGMYRMQVFGSDITGMHWHMHKGSAHHYQKYKELHQRMPVSVALGGDPSYTYSATAPLPENVDEYLFAGFLRKKKVELVKCLTNDLEVPADADFIIEGYVDPEEELILEGPFGDHTGFYSLADYYPRFHVTCITHRKNAVYPATIVGIPPMEDGWIGKATEKIFLMPIRMSAVPELKEMHMPVEGVFHNVTISKIEKSFPGQALKVMNSLWGAGQMMFNKIMIVFNSDIPSDNYLELGRVVSRNTDPLSDIHFIKGPVDVLDHSSRHFAFGSKMGIDATVKLPVEIDKPHLENSAPIVDCVKILKTFPEITAVNDNLLSIGISLVIITIHKGKQNHIRDLSQKLVDEGMVKEIKFVVFLDGEHDPSRLNDAAWICANNIDPVRDCFKVEAQNHQPYHGLFIDGTAKTAPSDHFQRDWPNIIVMDEKIIRNIDEKWNTLSLGPFLTSPSLRYKALVMSSGAVAKAKE